jgi:hypothetical protein
MANELLNPVAIAASGLVRLENNTVAMKMVNREFDDKFAVQDEKIGYVYNARLPVRFRGRRGDGMRPEPIREQIVPIAINELWGQDLEITDQDLTLTIDRFGERYVEPAVATIANMIDGDLLDQYLNVFSHVGTPGTVPTSVATYAQAGVELANNGTPKNQNMLAVVINPDMEANALGFNANLFNPAKDVTDQYRTGKMGVAVGFKWNSDQNVGRQTVGLCASSTPLVNGANQSGASIVTDGWAISTTVLNKGDIVAFGGSNGVNPISYRDTGRKRSYVVTADVVSDGSGNATITISPDLNNDSTSPFQTATTLPADNAQVFVYGVTGSTALGNISGVSTAQALAFHRDAFTIACVKQELPGGMEWSEFASNPKAGLWIRLVRGYSIQDNKKYTRFDVLGGVKTIRPELACRISG